MIEKILRSLFGMIDTLLGWCVSTLYSLIVQIANVNVFGDYIYEFMGRIYTFLAIFMVFKLSISVVNYVLNPDQLVDKAKGYSKLVQNVVIVIALLIAVPTIFDRAYELQSTILHTNVLYTIVTGRENDSTFEIEEWNGMSDEEKIKSIKDDAKASGDMIKYEIMSTFIYHSDTASSEEERAAVNKKDGACIKKASDPDSAYSTVFDCLMSSNTLTNTSEKNFGWDGGFTNEYKFLISTLCIGFVAYVFLVFCFDVSLRCVRLGVLQLIAPIPIISLLDPNSGKSGMFSKWLKDCTKTYTSLFVRLGGIFFAVEIIKSLTSPGRFLWYGTSTSVGFGFVKVFIILGCLMFAKDLPKFIEEILGVKMDAGALNLKKKLDSVPGLNRATGAAVGFAGGMAANAIAARQNFKGQGAKGFFKGAGSTVAGGLSGGFRGLTSKEKDGWKAGNAAIKASTAARNLRSERNELGEGGIKGSLKGWGERRIADIDKFAGIRTDDASKIAERRALGNKLFSDYGIDESGNVRTYTDSSGSQRKSKYYMDGKIHEEFGKAWETMDNAKDYRNKINKELDKAKAMHEANQEVSWNGKTGADAIAEMQVEANKASSAYDKAAADFKNLRAMDGYKADSMAYDAFNDASDRHDAEVYAGKKIDNVAVAPSSNPTATPTSTSTNFNNSSSFGEPGGETGE